jgi:mono/diheme cytochrome c family protein
LPHAKASDDGESTDKAQCLKCHGPNGDGQGHAQMKIKPADLPSDAVQQLSEEEIFKTSAFGAGHKEYAHAFAERGLSSKQIAQVVTSIRKCAKTINKREAANRRRSSPFLDDKKIYCLYRSL